MGFKERITDNFWEPRESPCTDLCTNYLGDFEEADGEIVPSCRAYPKGIPAKFVSGDEEHIKVEPDQAGDFVFLAK